MRNLKVILINCLLLCAPLVSASEIIGTIENVLDGDSVIFNDGANEYTLELWGIDAPELGESYGTQAKDELKKLLRITNNNVWVKTKSTLKGKKIIGILYPYPKQSNPISYGKTLVSLGLARANKKQTKRYVSIEKFARDSRFGIWGL